MFGSIGDLYRDRLRFVLDVARTYGDVAQYRVVHMRMYQINHPAGVGRLSTTPQLLEGRRDVRDTQIDPATDFSPATATSGDANVVWRSLLPQAAGRQAGDAMTSTLAMLERWRPSMGQSRPPTWRRSSCT